MNASMMQAPDQTAERTPDDRATEFKAVDNNANEQFSGYNLMVEAYAAIWLVLMIWLVMIWRKQASLAARVVGLEDALNRAEKKLAEKTTAKPGKGDSVGDGTRTKSADGRPGELEGSAAPLKPGES